MTAPVLSGREAPPRHNGELVFEAPWEGRVFGLAAALVEQRRFSWADFQARLVAAIDACPDAPYYESWLDALQSLVADLLV